MVIAIDPSEQFEYVLLADRALPDESPHKTVWTLRPLSRKEMLAIEDRTGLQRNGEIRLNLGKIKEDTLRAGLVGVRNFRDRAGREIDVEFENAKISILGCLRKPVTEAFLDRIPADAATELAEAIQTGNRLTLEEGKG